MKKRKTATEKDSHAVALAAKRTAKLSPRRGREIAHHAISVRWARARTVEGG